MRALEETENALVSYREQQRRLVLLADSARESGRAASIARVRYREGLADFLALLDAERTELQAQEAVAQAEAGVFTGVVGIYKSLGGYSAVMLSSLRRCRSEAGCPGPSSRAPGTRRRPLVLCRRSSRRLAAGL